MQEFREFVDQLLWVQILSSAGILAILGLLALVLFIPGMIRENDPRRITKAMTTIGGSVLLMIATAYLPFHAWEAERKLETACAAALSDLASGNVREVTQSMSLMVREMCGEENYAAAAGDHVVVAAR